MDIQTQEALRTHVHMTEEEALKHILKAGCPN